MHKQINKNIYLTKTQWQNNPFTGEIQKYSQDKVQPMVILYNIRKHINAETIIICTKI